MNCARCNGVMYCSRACLVDDWRRHKKLCTHPHHNLLRFKRPSQRSSQSNNRVNLMHFRSGDPSYLTVVGQIANLRPSRTPEDEWSNLSLRQPRCVKITAIVPSCIGKSPLSKVDSCALASLCSRLNKHQRN